MLPRLSPSLCIAALDAATAEEVVRALAARLHDAGHVATSFVDAALARERRSPTGLPFPRFAVAVPHAEPEHVLTPAIAVATLARSVPFGQMGTRGKTVDVSIVVMPALTAKEQAAAVLSSIFELLQDDALREALARATTATAIGDVLASHASEASAKSVEEGA